MASPAEQASATCRVLPLLVHLARVGSRAAEDALAAGDLRNRHVVALTLLAERGPASQQSLAEAFRLDPSNVVALLNELEERDLVIRRRDPADRRRHIVELSAHGREELLEAQATLGATEDRVLHGLSAEDRATLRDLLARAIGAGGPEAAACLARDDPC